MHILVREKNRDWEEEESFHRRSGKEKTALW